MSKYRILVVDDSALTRKLLKKILEADPQFVVTYAAPTAQLAYNYLEQNKVDLITLDVDMPDISGIEAGVHIRRKWPGTPILMCSSMNNSGTKVRLITPGQDRANFVSKPKNQSEMEFFKTELLRKARGLIKSPGESTPGIKQSPVLSVNEISVKLAPRLACPRTPRALAIGSSTGGPEALTRFYSHLSSPFPVPTFIVQHMPADFTRKLAERLAAKTGFVFKEGEHNEEVQPETTYIAPGGKHMVVVEHEGRQLIRLNEDPPEHSCRPAVDVLFRSLRDVYQASVLAAVFTGMGADGSGGTKALQQAGAEIVVQDLESCVVPSMPRASLDAGSVHQVLPLKEIARLFVERSSIAFKKLG